MAEEWKPTGSRLAGKTAIVTGTPSSSPALPSLLLNLS
jgi:hypothetical protein